MGLFDDSDIIEDDDYISTSVDDDEEELGYDGHFIEDPKKNIPAPVLDKSVSKPVSTKTTERIRKKLPQRFKERGIVSMQIVKRDGKEYIFI